MTRTANVTSSFRTLVTGAIGCACLSLSSAASADSLKSYDVDPTQISVSGISSGADIAHQLHVAYSSIFKGAGLLAAAPYACAKGSLDTAFHVCSTFMLPFRGPPVVQDLVEITKDEFRKKNIDDPVNLADDKVYLFRGTSDRYVPESVMNTVQDYYIKIGVTPQNIQYVKTVPAEHAQVTNDYGNTCGYFGAPYINNCKAQAPNQADTAGDILKHIYGELADPSTVSTHGLMLTFPQSDFVVDPSRISMDPIGHIYVPRDCAEGRVTCKLHVALHGCDQNDDTYPEHAGYNEWADANDIIILYPRVKVSNANPTNPQGCWDWWGYTDANYFRRSGPQMMAVKAMIDHVAGLMGAPAALRVKRSDNQADLAWLPLTSKDLAGYNVYRSTSTPVAIDDTHRVASRIQDAAFADAGLTEKKYYYTVTAIDRAGKETGHGPDVSTDGTGTGSCVLSAYPITINDPQACKTLCDLKLAVCGW